MPITIKTNTIKYRKPNGDYEDFNAIAQQSTAEQIAAIQQKGLQTIASIPNDYTTLTNNVGQLSEETYITTDTHTRALYTTPRKSSGNNGYFALQKAWRYTVDGTQDNRQEYKDRSVTTYALAIADFGTRITVNPAAGKNYVFNVLCYSSSSIGSVNYVFSPTGSSFVSAGKDILISKLDGATHFIVQIRNLGNDPEDATYKYFKTLSENDISEIQSVLNLFNYTDPAIEDKNIENYLYYGVGNTLQDRRIARRVGYGISADTGLQTTNSTRISTYTGNNAVSTRYIRALKFMPLEGESYNYIAQLFGYNAEGTFIGKYPEIIFDGKYISIDPSWVRFGITFRRTDNATMDQQAETADLDSTIIWGSTYLYERTDRTLSLRNAPADAYETGLAIAEMQNNTRNDPMAIESVVSVAKTWFDNRTTQYDGSQAIFYHDAATPAERASILDVNTPTLHTPNIECSTLIGMILRGYSFNETTYSPLWTGGAMSAVDWVQNPEHFWAINPFDWTVSSRADGTNPSRVRIAAALGRWMEQHGLSIPAEKMEPGDIVFFARKNQQGEWINPALYRKINHVAMVYKIVDTLQGNVYGIDPDVYPKTHFIIEAGHDESERETPVEPYEDSNQGDGHGSIYIRPLETRLNDDENGINTICLVCRTRLGTMWDEERHKEIQALKALIN